MENKNEVTREMMVDEALRRMKMLDIMKQPIKEFKEEGKINLSENGGFLYWINEEQQKYVDEFEKKYDCLVYHIVHTYAQFGELLVMLYVSSHPEEWEYDMELIDGVYSTYAYVVNLTVPDFSEIGGVGVKPSIGGVVQVW